MAAENFNFPAMSPASCDIFCNVIDNYGDIGVSWRLARQLANEHSLAVRLWVDDLGSLAKMCPEVDVEAKQQMCRSVELCHWTADAFFMLPQPLFCSWEGGAAELVIEAFACKLPQSYIEAMVAQQKKPVWVNLEHLSAEDWVE
ncbi:MAG: elongation factor P maturation arginine rhamnosyltransferase EarP, partial [Gallionella sp.]